MQLQAQQTLNLLAYLIQQVPNYYKIITQPKDFTQIKRKLQRSHPNHYQSIKAFLFDLRQVFINCAIYNKVNGSFFAVSNRVAKFALLQIYISDVIS